MLDFEYVQKDLGAEIYDPEALSERLSRASSQTYFDVLEVHEISGRAEIEAGYQRMVSLFGPDAVANREPEVKGLAAQFLEKAREAYEHLIDDARRRRYRLQVSGEARCRTFSSMQQSKGESELFLKQDYDKAVELFSSAVEIFPPNVEAKALFGLSVFMKNYPIDRREAQKGFEMMNEAVKAGQNVPRVYICLGLAYRAMRKRAEAHKALTRAVQLQPSNAEARHILSTLDKKLGQKV